MKKIEEIIISENNLNSIFNLINSLNNKTNFNINETIESIEKELKEKGLFNNNKNEFIVQIIKDPKYKRIITKTDAHSDVTLLKDILDTLRYNLTEEGKNNPICFICTGDILGKEINNVVKNDLNATILSIWLSINYYNRLNPESPIPIFFTIGNHDLKIGEENFLRNICPVEIFISLADQSLLRFGHTRNEDQLEKPIDLNKLQNTNNYLFLEFSKVKTLENLQLIQDNQAWQKRSKQLEIIKSNLNLHDKTSIFSFSGHSFDKNAHYAMQKPNQIYFHDDNNDSKNQFNFLDINKNGIAFKELKDKNITSLQSPIYDNIGNKYSLSYAPEKLADNIFKSQLIVIDLKKQNIKTETRAQFFQNNKKIKQNKLKQKSQNPLLRNSKLLELIPKNERLGLYKKHLLHNATYGLSPEIVKKQELRKIWRKIIETKKIYILNHGLEGGIGKNENVQKNVSIEGILSPHILIEKYGNKIGKNGMFQNKYSVCCIKIPIDLKEADIKQNGLLSFIKGGKVKGYELRYNETSKKFEKVKFEIQEPINIIKNNLKSSENSYSNGVGMAIIPEYKVTNLINSQYSNGSENAYFYKLMPEIYVANENDIFNEFKASEETENLIKKEFGLQENSIITWYHILKHYWQIERVKKGLPEIPIVMDTNGKEMAEEDLSRLFNIYNNIVNELIFQDLSDEKIKNFLNKYENNINIKKIYKFLNIQIKKILNNEFEELKKLDINKLVKIRNNIKYLLQKKDEIQIAFEERDLDDLNEKIKKRIISENKKEIEELVFKDLNDLINDEIVKNILNKYENSIKIRDIYQYLNMHIGRLHGDELKKLDITKLVKIRNNINYFLQKKGKLIGEDLYAIYLHKQNVDYLNEIIKDTPI